MDRAVARRVRPKVLALANNPRPAGVTKLRGYDDFFRIRIGDYRVVYRIDDSRRIVEIAIIAHRREVYRDL